MISRNRIKGSQKKEMRALARDVILKIGATSTWIDLQKVSLDGTLESKIKEAVSKIQPVRGVMIRRTQLIQAGVVTQDGPTLDEIREQERAEDSEFDEEAEEPSEEEEEPESEAEREAAEEPEAADDAPDYPSMTVVQLKDLLREAGKPVSGNKAELIERLKE